MDGTGFLKTVSFGGFDKKDVLNYVDELNTKIYTLQEELEQKNNLLEQSDSGAEVNEKYEKLLAEDKKKIADLQTNNDSLKNQMKTLQDESAEKDKEIADLKNKNAQLENELIDAKNKAAAASSVDANAMDLTNVFMEAQKTANTIVTQAKANSKKMDEDAKRLANQVVDDANSKASTIVKSADEKANKLIIDAEARSSAIIADAEDKSAEMKAAAAEMKAMILAEVSEMDNKVKTIKDAIESLHGDSVQKLDSAHKTIEESMDFFKNGQIPASLTRQRPAAPEQQSARTPAAAPSPAQPRQPIPMASAQAHRETPPQAQAPAQPRPVAKPIPPVARQSQNTAPKPVPKINFNLSELEEMAKNIEADVAKTSKNGK